jgi:hypothetical protein
VLFLPPNQANAQIIKELKIMTHRVKRPPAQWIGCSTKEMCLIAGVSADTLKSWRVQELLRKGTHYYTLPDSTKIIWVRDLVRDWLVNGGDSPAHQRACEKYLASLPSSGVYSPSTSA